MHLARWTRMQRRLDPSLDAPNADTLDRRAVDLHSFSDLVVGQTRTIDAFVRLQEDARMHQGPRRRLAFESNACNCTRSSQSVYPVYFMERHFTGNHLLGDPAL